MAGTTPLIIQAPASDPINNRIRMEDIAELMLCRIPFCRVFQLTPIRIAKSPATPADKIRTIWLDPSRAESPKIVTFKLSRIIRNVIGINASTNVGFLVFSAIN